MPRLLRSALLLSLAAVLAAPPALAQTDPNLERGFAPEKVYSFGEIDQVNLFNGNLSLTLPIGARYPVNGGLSYGLTLVYNSNVWDFSSRSEKVYQQTVTYTVAKPSKESNAGLGWTLSLGKLHGANTHGSPFWRYTGEDGAEHVFYSTLHAGETSTSGFHYTRDGTYLRLKVLSGGLGAEVEHPDGTIKKFTGPTTSGPFQLVQIRDRFGNAVNVTYPSATRWTLSDGHRTHDVYFTTLSTGETVVQRVSLAAFGGGRAEWTFGYAVRTISRSCQDDDPATSATLAAGLLTSVTYPDGSQLAMAGASDYNTACSDGTATIANLPGTLARLKLPTLGTLEWTYQAYLFPVRGVGIPQSVPVSIANVAGIKTKRVLNAAGTCETWDGVGCQWTYTPQHVSPEHRTTTVALPTGDSTVHHFHQGVVPSTATWHGWQYGLPIHPSTTDGAGRFLSQEIYDGGTKVRSVYLTYEHDTLPATTTFIDQWYSSNRRVRSDKTVYHDDAGRHATADRSEFDGLGHYRRETTSGSFGAGDARTSYSQYNPVRGVYEISTATNSPTGSHTYTAWPTSSAWVLGTTTENWVQEAGQTFKTQSCHDPVTGRLLRQRALAGASPGSNDVLVVYSADAAGNLTREEWSGGDNQFVSTGDLCTLVPPAPLYRQDHSWAFGAKATTRWVDGSGVALPFYAVQRTIDASTGLPSAEYDVSGLRTDLVYDGMARLTWEKPQTGHGAWTEYKYAKATSASALANVHVVSWPNGSVVGALAQSKVTFDAFGRPWKDERLGAGGTWSRADTVWNAMGWKRSVSERQAGVPSKLTIFKGFDPFGRPTTIQPPDGTAHDVTLGYTGVREVARTVKIGTAAGVETSATTTERYDRQGRLWQVVEPSGASGALTTTTYGYDAAGRLKSVSTPGGGTTQTRAFTYDGRGFLLSERHPEKGISGNGTVTYAKYDPLGNVGRKVDGPWDLSFFYDRAARLTAVRDTGGSLRLWKSFVYGGTNVGSDRRLGKLTQADRYNHISIGGTPFTVDVRETYSYTGVGGRVSTRTTENWVNGGLNESFTQSWLWNDLGEPATLYYPRCTWTGCSGTATTTRTASFGYTHGWLTSVPGYASAIGYHPSGMVSSVAHANGVTWTQGADPNGMARPASYSTTGASVNWSSGTYSYDGAGNVKAVGTSSFLYDPVSRLTSGTVYTGETGGGTAKTQGYTYDPFGNIQSITGTSAVSTPTAAATNRLTGATYDAAGNVTWWNGNTFAYDPFGMAWRTVMSGVESIHLYTADDERFWTYQPTGSRWTLRDLDGKVLSEFGSGGGWTVQRDHVFRDGTMLAAKTPTGETLHYHPDHLGTPRLVTGTGGAKRAYHVYLPYGEEATAINQDADRLKFTGHERDLGYTTSAEDDLDYHHARYYLPRVGRYLGSDPVGGEVATPQSWNRFSYALGNPVKYVDPRGLVAHPDCPQPCDSIDVIGQEPKKKKERPLPDFVALLGFFIEASVERGASTGFGFLDVSTAQSFYVTGFERAAVEGRSLEAAFYFGVNELFVPESQGELGVELAMAVIPVGKAAKIAKLGVQARAATGRPAQRLLVSMAEKAGLRVVPGGSHLKVFSPETGRLITTIPHSPSGAGTIKKITREILESVGLE